MKRSKNSIMPVSNRTIIFVGNFTLLTLIINIFLSSALTLLISTFLVIAVHFMKIPRIDESKISENIHNLFKLDKNNVLKNTIFHKGGAFHAPENTLEAIEQAVKLGVSSVEVDLDFTKDGVGVLIHGPTVDETTDGKGLVSDHTLEQIQSLNAAAKFPNRDEFPAACVPTLESCIELCIRHKLVVFIDCKSNPSKTADLIGKLYQKYPKLYDLGIVCSFYPTIIYAVRKADPNILTGLTHRNFILSQLGGGIDRNKELWKKLIAPWLDILLSWAHWSFLWYFCGNSFFLCCKDNVSFDNKKFWDSLGVRMVIWTVNDSIEKEYLLKTLEIPIITDGFHRPKSIH
ncbi:unnamed protein product [Lymnaea stagnalis]|uniref:GP-PDE domain-containing protein n=1 Tax=Lymnaea stagnalis TaxID=6523 RepID=A0AAV2H9S6_LYMST